MASSRTRPPVLRRPAIGAGRGGRTDGCSRLAEAGGGEFARYRAHGDLAEAARAVGPGTGGPGGGSSCRSRQPRGGGPADATLASAMDSQARCRTCHRSTHVDEALAAVSESLERMNDGALYDLQREAGAGRVGGPPAAARRRPDHGEKHNLEASWAVLGRQAEMAWAAEGPKQLWRVWWAVAAGLRATRAPSGVPWDIGRRPSPQARRVAALPQGGRPLRHERFGPQAARARAGQSWPRTPLQGRKRRWPRAAPFERG